ncbi:MAG: hypothetical protein J6V09_00125 [Clostridia bacterium]|nr:hypothetical protein [Clostridia bacterium]
MVKKLFKHEFIYYLRSFGIFPLMLIVASLFLRFIMFFDPENFVVEVLGITAFIVFYIMCFTIGIAALVIAVVRFYRNMYTAEGYLTFTLPVTSDQHILVKLLSALACQVISHLTVFLAMFIAVADMETFSDIGKMFTWLGGLINSVGVWHFVFYAFEAIILLAIGSATSMLLFYGCVTVGQTATKNRIFTAIAAYFIYYLGTQILSTVTMLIASRVMLTGVFDGLITWVIAHPYASIHIGAWIGVAVASGLGVAFWFITRTIMNKKLNLE